MKNLSLNLLNSLLDLRSKSQINQSFFERYAVDELLFWGDYLEGKSQRTQRVRARLHQIEEEGHSSIAQALEKFQLTIWLELAGKGPSMNCKHFDELFDHFGFFARTFHHRSLYMDLRQFRVAFLGNAPERVFLNWEEASKLLAHSFEEFEQGNFLQALSQMKEAHALRPNSFFYYQNLKMMKEYLKIRNIYLQCSEKEKRYKAKILEIYYHQMCQKIKNLVLQERNFALHPFWQDHDSEFWQRALAQLWENIDEMLSDEVRKEGKTFSQNLSYRLMLLNHRLGAFSYQLRSLNSTVMESEIFYLIEEMEHLLETKQSLNPELDWLIFRVRSLCLWKALMQRCSKNEEAVCLITQVDETQEAFQKIIGSHVSASFRPQAEVLCEDLTLLKHLNKEVEIKDLFEATYYLVRLGLKSSLEEEMGSQMQFIRELIDTCSGVKNLLSAP